MKKKIIFIVAAVLIIAIPVLILNFVKRTNKGGLENGKYKVTDCKEFPDACIIVKGNTIQLENIDLNSIYREGQLEQIMKIQHEGIADLGYSDVELEEMSDLNKIFIENKFTFDERDITKDGTYTYLYRCYCDGNLFGLYFLYDSWNKTIKINNYQKEITFAK